MIKKVVVVLLAVSLFLGAFSINTEASAASGFLKWLASQIGSEYIDRLFDEIDKGGGSSQTQIYKIRMKKCDPKEHGEGKVEVFCGHGGSQECMTLPCTKVEN